jgi:type I restriction enzyme S subunit
MHIMADASAATRPGSLRRFKPYPAYKDSGVEWVGQIPAEWQSLKLKRVCTFVYGDSLASDVRVDGGIEVYGSNGPVGAHYRANTLAPCLVIGRKGSFGKVNFSSRPLFAIDTTFVVDRRFTQADIRWLYYVLTDARLDSATKDSAIPGLDREDAYAREVCLCPPAEQRAIAAFLDRETARIDALVAKKERLIELLQEKRAALITHAVTKGLDLNVPMKDSGVEWLDEIPVHWEVNRAKFVARLRSGHTPSRQHPDYWQHCTIPWFGLVDVWQIRDGQTEFVSETTEKISELGLANSAARLLPKGTVMLSRTASVGFSAIMGVDMATTQDFVNWVCGPTLRPEYLLYVFRSMGHEFRRLTMGSTHQTIYMPDVGRFAAPIPPVPEQDQLVAFIRKETAKTDALVSKVRDAIARLKELRTALISAAVTGKIDVREEASA